MSGAVAPASLAALQGAFRDYLLGRSNAFLAEVSESDRADRTTLLGVYHEGYALRLIEVLTADYPGLHATVGAESFDSLARAYIAAHPSRHPSVRWYGRGLADFLAATSPWNGSPTLGEMAQFEWLLGEAWDAPDCVPAVAKALIALPAEAWETLSFEVVPSLRCLTLGFEVPQAWGRRAEVGPAPLVVAPAPAPVPWVIWRPDLECFYRSLEADQAALLAALVAGLPFPELCESLVGFEGEGEAVARAAGLLRAWVEAGMIAGFHR